MKSVIIGSGNVATVLGRKMLEAGHEILQVTSRDAERARILANKLGCPSNVDFKNVSKKGELYLVAISDQALHDLNKRMQLDHAVVVHTAGSVALNVLKNVSVNFGVLYPLQSLRMEMTDMPEIPFLVDGNTPETLTLIYDFAETISTQVQHANDDQRLRLHLAAVVANNFTNHLFALTEEFCKREMVDFELLLPLIKETANRIQYYSPEKLQTGPASRDDLNTIASHIELLKDHPGLKKLYEVLTKSIRSNQKK